MNERPNEPYEWKIYYRDLSIISGAINAHTSGMDQFDHPEFQIVFSHTNHSPSGYFLNEDRVYDMLNEMGMRVKNGERFESGDIVQGLLEDRNIYLENFMLYDEMALRMIVPSMPNKDIDEFIFDSECALKSIKDICEEDYDFQLLPTDLLEWDWMDAEYPILKNTNSILDEIKFDIDYFIEETENGEEIIDSINELEIYLISQSDIDYIYIEKEIYIRDRALQENNLKHIISTIEEIITNSDVRGVYIQMTNGQPLSWLSLVEQEDMNYITNSDNISKLPSNVVPIYIYGKSVPDCCKVQYKKFIPNCNNALCRGEILAYFDDVLDNLEPEEVIMELKSLSGGRPFALIGDDNPPYCEYRQYIAIWLSHNKCPCIEIK